MGRSVCRSGRMTGRSLKLTRKSSTWELAEAMIEGRPSLTLLAIHIPGSGNTTIEFTDRHSSCRRLAQR